MKNFRIPGVVKCCPLCMIWPFPPELPVTVSSCMRPTKERVPDTPLGMELGGGPKAPSPLLVKYSHLVDSRLL